MTKQDGFPKPSQPLNAPCNWPPAKTTPRWLPIWRQNSNCIRLVPRSMTPAHPVDAGGLYWLPGWIQTNAGSTRSGLAQEANTGITLLIERGGHRRSSPSMTTSARQHSSSGGEEACQCDADSYHETIHEKGVLNGRRAKFNHRAWYSFEILGLLKISSFSANR